MKEVRKKILPNYFKDVKSGIKTFEVRKDEDNIQVGDTLILEEWRDGDIFTSGYTGRCIRKKVKYVLRNIPQYGLQEGYCIIGLEESKNGWIPCEKELPPMPKENPLFENKPLELYLVSIGSGYPWRAFWNGKYFTDGWSTVDAIAWQPLPAPYKPGE